jgi:hypothetical protein
MRVRVASLSERQAEALRRLDGEVIAGRGGVAPNTWRSLEGLGLVSRHDDEDGTRWLLTADGEYAARQLRQAT